MGSGRDVLSVERCEQILERIPRLSVGVVGDLFLDRYLDIDGTLTEPSLETGLDAYQVVRVRASPGAAGTVINNLVTLGVGSVHAISVIGDDGEGYELQQALTKQGVRSQLIIEPSRRTPTYTKPMLQEQGRPARELNRLDIKNRAPLPGPAEDAILGALAESWPRLDALVVVDQVSEDGCGVITAAVRKRLAELGSACPDKIILADSRERIGLFSSVWLKPNQRECIRAVAGPGEAEEITACVRLLAHRTGRPVFCTLGGQGMLVADPRRAPFMEKTIPAVPVTGPIDVVGAGDSTSAALCCAIAVGATLPEAAAFGNLVASITIQQIGTTGTATPAQIRALVV
jgi:rfaE bifunctional protein kinase chain/domain